MRRLLLAALLLSACDSAAPVPEPEPGPAPLPTLTATPQETLTSTAASPFRLALGQSGAVRSPIEDNASSRPYVLASSGLWAAGVQGGTLRAAASFSLSSFGPCPGGSGGVYHLFAGTAYSLAGWPVARGAPTDASGAPRPYGDEMLWATMCQSPVDFPSLALFDGLRTNVAVFQRTNTPNVVFVRYEIANTSAVPITDLSVGLWADPDFTVNRQGLTDNLVGLDDSLGLAYVYFDQVFDGGTANPAGTARAPAQRGHVAGVALLETPRGAGLAVHRVLTKGAGPFQEPTSGTAQGFANALRGLTSDGSPQADWTTGRPDPLAFTGDPVMLTGWLDGTGPLDPDGLFPSRGVQRGRETRFLLASGASALRPGETATLTVAWTVADGPALRDALGRLKARTEALRAAPSLWRF